MTSYDSDSSTLSFRIFTNPLVLVFWRLIVVSLHFAASFIQLPKSWRARPLEHMTLHRSALVSRLSGGKRDGIMMLSGCWLRSWLRQ